MTTLLRTTKNLYSEIVGDKEIFYSYNTTVAVKTPIELMYRRTYGVQPQVDT